MLLGSAIRDAAVPRTPRQSAFQVLKGRRAAVRLREGNHGEFGEITRDYADSFINVITVIINMLYDNTRSFTFVRLNSNE